MVRQVAKGSPAVVNKDSTLPSLIAAFLFFLTVSVLSVPVATAAEDGKSTAPEVAYTVTLEGVPEEDIATLLEESSQLVALRGRPPASLAGLRRRAADDAVRLVEVLRAKGFYSAKVTPRIDSSVSPATVELAVDTGVLYLIGGFVIDYGEESGHGGLVNDLEELGLHFGLPAEGATVVAAQDKLLQRLSENGHPLARVVNRLVTVDHADTTMQVELEVDPGPLVRFGQAEFRGLEMVDVAYLQRLVPWTPGSVYDAREVERLRKRLWTTNLFRTVTPVPADQPSTAGTLPVVVDLVERERRTISTGVSYSTDRGPGGDISWEHRNLFGQQETLLLTAAADTVEQSLTADFRKPHVGRFDQNALANGTIKHQDTDAFRERTAAAFVGVERKFAEVWSLRAGPSLDYSVLTDNDGERTYLIGGFPLSLTRDTTDNTLDPTEGTRLSLGLIPSIGTIEREIVFLTQEIGGSGYLSLTDADRIILAGRFRLASLLGAATDDVPASKRIYAGGGGSVRGYGYQSLGPLDAENDPLGGRSAVEFGFETRLRLTDRLGLVPFIEGGNVYDSEYPEFDEELRWAAGIGARYFTRIGPLRIDLAFPLNGRDDIDSDFEFYVSLGQAF